MSRSKTKPSDGPFVRGTRVKLRGERGWWIVDYRSEDELSCTKLSGNDYKNMKCNVTAVTAVVQP